MSFRSGAEASVALSSHPALKSKQFQVSAIVQLCMTGEARTLAGVWFSSPAFAVLAGPIMASCAVFRNIALCGVPADDLAVVQALLNEGDDTSSRVAASLVQNGGLVAVIRMLADTRGKAVAVYN